MNKIITGYKVFNSDWTCRDFKYEVGKSYEMEEFPELCNIGFHFCKKAINCFDYYSFDKKNKVAMVEAYGDIVGSESDKMATNKIKILHEIVWSDLLDIVNSGDMNSGNSNSGNSNSGNSNSGDRNSGDRNSGDRNSGDRNSGDRNSGDRNSGSWNSGNMNSGDRNSGNMNSGDRNSGNWNSGNWNSGDWNSKTPEHIYFFNKFITMKEYKNIKQSEAYRILNRFKLVKYRIKTSRGKYGDFKYLSFKSSFKTFWRNISFQERLKIKSIPHFDKDVFYEITGVKV